jgi:hypothetical protein
MVPTLSGQASQSLRPAEQVLQYTAILFGEAVDYAKLMQQLMDQRLGLISL